MKLTLKNGKYFLTGRIAEIGNALSKTASNKDPIDQIDFGWTLSKMADEASNAGGEQYICNDCSCVGLEHEFPNGGCPKCRGKNISKI